MKVIYRYKFLGLTVKNEMVLLPDGKTVQMAITQGQFCLFDIMDLKYVICHRWCAAKNGNTFYVMTKVKLDDGKRKTLLLHKLLMNPESDLVVDHIDGNGLNNTRKNLRICSQSENLRNQKISSNNSSGYKGVYFDQKENKFRSRINLNNRRFHLGYFENPENAALAYNIAAKEFFGDFSLLNDIPENTYLSKHEIKTLYRQMRKIRSYLENSIQN